MISQTDAAALSTPFSNTNNSIISPSHHQHQNLTLTNNSNDIIIATSPHQPKQAQQQNPNTAPTTTNHNGGGGGAKVSKGGGVAGSVKKRKKFDETIIDGFAIISFKTWEDLQDELNDRNSINTNNNNNNSNNNSISNSGAANNLDATNNNNSKCTTDATSTSKKANSKSKSKSSLANHHQLANSTNAPPSLSSASTLITPASVNSNVGNKEVTSSSNNANNNNSSSKKKKDKATKGGAGHHQSSNTNNNKATNQLTKDKRNKTSSEKNTLKRALEAKELAEKRLSILQEKLEREQSKNRNLDHKTTSSIPAAAKTTNVPSEHYVSHDTIPVHVLSCKEEKQLQQHQNQYQHQHQQPQPQQPLHHSSRANGMLDQVPMRDFNQPPPKPMPYSPFHINSHIHRQDPTIIHNQMQILHQTTLNPPQSPPRNHQQSNLSHNQAQQQSQHQHSIKPSAHLMHQHKSTPPLPQLHHQPPISVQQLPQQSQPIPPPPPSHLLHQQAQQTPPPQSQSSLHQSHPYYTHKHPSQLSTPQPQTHSHQHSHAHLLQQQQQHQPPIQSPLNPYSHQPQSSIISSMGLSSLPSPYSCPPSIYITDTISRQTSIIPPPSLGPALEQTNPQTPGNRFGHSSVLQSIAPYTPPVPTPHHPMYYPTLPTERSFIEFARSYTGPGHLGYPNLMNSFPTSSPSTTANPYSFDRWPRMALDQRAVSRYNSLYQSTTILPDRTYANYTTTRAPSFPAGLFPPPF